MCQDTADWSLKLDDWFTKINMSDSLCVTKKFRKVYVISCTTSLQSHPFLSSHATKNQLADGYKKLPFWEVTNIVHKTKLFQILTSILNFRR